jgi:hypothetical protein
MCVFTCMFSGQQTSKAGDLCQPIQGRCKCRYHVLSTVIQSVIKPHMLIAVLDLKQPPTSFTYHLPRIGGGYNSMCACMTNLCSHVEQLFCSHTYRPETQISGFESHGVLNFIWGHLNIWGSSKWNMLHINFLACKILRWQPTFLVNLWTHYMQLYGVVCVWLLLSM